MPSETEPMWIDEREAARLLDFSEGKLYGLRKKNLIPFARIGRHIRYRAEALREWARRQEQGPKTEAS